jgi:hypothetical protein
MVMPNFNPTNREKAAMASGKLCVGWFGVMVETSSPGSMYMICPGSHVFFFADSRAELVCAGKLATIPAALFRLTTRAR